MPSIEAGKTVGRTGIKADKDLTNAEKIIFGLKNKNQTLSSAESMTAGGFGYAVTRVPGSSLVYKGGVATYMRETKKNILGLPNELFDSGLVTSAITLAMAERALGLFQTDYAVACTGNAGPTRNDKITGVGRVYWAIVDATGRNIVREFDFFGNRDEVRTKAITEGLRMTRNFIESTEG